MEEYTNIDRHQKGNGANCNAKVSTGFFVFLIVVAVIAVACWLILR